MAKKKTGIITEEMELSELKKAHDELFTKIHKQISNRDDLVTLLELEAELTRRETE